MTYIFLVAGKGTRMSPLTQNFPKSLFKLDKDETVLERMVSLIRKYDNNARIVLVAGFMHEMIKEVLPDVINVINPFFSVTNSIASLWFARQYLDDENTIIINGDIVMSENLVKDIVCTPSVGASVLIDSSIKNDGDYNIQVIDNQVVVMSKGLSEYFGEYAGITKLDRSSAMLLQEEIEYMIKQGQYNLWYEEALVQLIFERNFILQYNDICDYDWTEIDSVNDLLHARKIHQTEQLIRNPNY